MSHSNVSRGWYRRGNLPHCDFPGLIQFITWHLGDSLPVPVQERVANQLAALPLSNTQREIEWRKKMEVLLDRGYGNCWLRRKRYAQIAMDVFLKADGSHYQMHALTVMPNHVHLLVEFLPGYRMGDVIKDWKRVTTLQMHEALGRSDQLWQENYRDRYMRDALHYEQTIRYILLNPVRAGLVKCVHKWPWMYHSKQLKFHPPQEWPAVSEVEKEEL